MDKKKLSIYLTLTMAMTAVVPGVNQKVNAADAVHTTLVANESDITYLPPLVEIPDFTQTQLLTEVQELSQISEPTQIPEPSQTLEPTQNPDPSQGPEPTQSPEPSDTPQPTQTPSPTVVPKPTITPSPKPTKAPFRSETLNKMSDYDYVGKSVTGVSKRKETVKSLQSKVQAYGTLYGIGMPYEEYQNAMSYLWTDATEYDKKPVKITVNIKNSMNYSSYVNTLKKLSRYEGVYLYKIGKSTEGRDLYAIEVDMGASNQKKVMMLTGQIHAREFAGGTFIVKELVDLVQKAQTDKKTMELLKKYKFVAVPIVNVDGREALIESPSKWTIKGGDLWKAYINGTDGGRNFPGLQWGQVASGSKYKSSIALKPGYANYPGAYGGSNNETKAMMKWLYHYTVVEQASLYLDMHQQGSIIYAGKTWQTKKQEQKSQDLRTNVMNVLNKGITRRKYVRVYEGSLYGLKGEGSSLTDYAVSLAVGAKFSPAYGFHAFSDGKKEFILMQVKDLDLSKLKVKEANPNFAAITIEIGYGTKYLGDTASTRRLLANEYNYYNYGKLLEALPQVIK